MNQKLLKTKAGSILQFNSIYGCGVAVLFIVDFIIIIIINGFFVVMRLNIPTYEAII